MTKNHSLPLPNLRIHSAVLVYIGTSLDHKFLTSGEKELITSITSGAAFFGAIFAGLTADKYGRKPAIYVGCVLFIIGAILQAASFGLAQMTVGRLVVGFGVGSAAMIGTFRPLCLVLYHLMIEQYPCTSPRYHQPSTEAA
jgi:MFS family permease